VVIFFATPIATESLSALAQILAAV
jgi:hypothetical protein